VSATVKLSSKVLRFSCRSALVFIVGRGGGDLTVSSGCEYVER
jgi:hypothetical protein